MNHVIIGGRAHTFEQAKEVFTLGYPFAETSLYDPQTVEEELDDLISLKERFGRSYLAHYPNEGNPFDADMLEKEFVPKIKTLLDLSKKLDISKGTIHFWMDRRWASSELISRKINLLNEMSAYADHLGIVLCIENLSERFESFQLAFEAIPSLRMTLDIGHAQLLAKENTSFGFIQRAFEKIAHIHVHDNNGGTSVKDDLHLPLGQGMVDYPNILTQLKNHGYNSTITMEVKPSEMQQTRNNLERYML